MPYVKNIKRDDSGDVDNEIGDRTKANVASTVLPYLSYTIEHKSKGDTVEDDDAVGSIYTCVLNRSNYGKSCSGKMIEELLEIESARPSPLVQ